MYSFYYHIPSAMMEGKWNVVLNANNNEKWAASRAVIVHYRGSEYPSEVEVWLKRKARTSPAGNPPKIKKFLCVEKDKWVYDAQRIPEKKEAEA